MELLDGDPTLRAELARDPKGTVLYSIPRRLGLTWLDADDELELVSLGESAADER